MANNLSDYLDSIKTCLKCDSAVKASVARELGTHLEDKSQELTATGLSEDEANNIATESFGPPQLNRFRNLKFEFSKSQRINPKF